MSAISLTKSNWESRSSRLVSCQRCEAQKGDACTMYQGYGSVVQSHSERRGFWVMLDKGRTIIAAGRTVTSSARLRHMRLNGLAGK